MNFSDSKVPDQSNCSVVKRISAPINPLQVFHRLKSVKKGSLLMTLIFAVIAPFSANAAQWRNISGLQNSSHLGDFLTEMVTSGKDVHGFAHTPGGKWILAYDNHLSASAGFPSQFFNEILSYVQAGNKVAAADCNGNGACIVIYDNWGYHRMGSIPSSLTERIKAFKNKGWKIRDVELTNNGYVLLGPGNVVGWGGTTNGLGKALKDTHKAKRIIRDLAVGFDNEWAFMAGHNPMYKDIPAAVINKLDHIAKSSGRLRHISFARDGRYFVHTRGSDVPSNNSSIAQIEWGLGSDGTTNIWERMSELEIPGASIAIIEPGTHNPKVSVTRGYGLKKEGENGGAVLTTTPFALASLSKFLGALTALSAASHNGINIDGNVFNEAGSGQLTNWRDIGNDNDLNDTYGIPNTNLSGGITLRRLLSHTAGFPRRGVPRINVKHFDLAAEQPTIWWLLGLQCSSASEDACTLPGNNYVWQEAPAGSQYDYSNDGYMVVQAFIEDITGMDIHEFLDYQLFGTLGMKSARSEINKPDSYLAKSAWQHGEDGPAADWTAHAPILASNIYSSSADYAKAMILALNGGVNTENETIIPFEFIDALLQRQDYDGGTRTSPYGFGIQLDNSATEFTDQDFFHGGDFTNRAKTFMCGNPTRDQGIVVLLNSGAPNAGRLIGEIRRAYVDAVGWPSGVTCN